MPRKYSRKTARGTTPEDVLKRAAAAVENGESVRGVAKEFGINRMTLKRYISKRNVAPNEPTGYTAIAQKQSIFSPVMEEELAAHIKLLANMFHGLSLLKCRELAYQFAQRNNLSIRQNWEKNGKAGIDWWLGFKSRHHLSIRTPEATSFARASAFNRPVVNQFYDNLASVMDKHHFEPKDVYNTDETGCTTVQKPRDVVAEQGKKQIGSITSGERGELVTVVYTVSASGNVLPPMFIFPRVNYRDHFIRGSPPGSIGRATKSGWINENLFRDYIEHIVQHTRCSIDHKILLIMDNHESHISLSSIDFAKSNGIVLLTIPPHTSHRLQPLDRSVYGPFKSALSKAMDGWLRSNPGKTITIYEIPELVNEAHMQAMLPRNILSGFQSTGICPFNRDLFSDHDFAPADTTDRPLDLADEGIQAPDNEESTDVAPISSTSSDVDSVQQPSSIYVSPSAVIPVPKAGPRKSSNRRKGSTKILTDTPERDEVAAQLHDKQSKLTNSKKSQFQQKNKTGILDKQSKLTKSKKSLFQQKNKTGIESSDETTSESECDTDSTFSLQSDAFNELECDEIMEGDFIVVKFAGKSRTVHYIARVDVVHGTDFEGIFLKKISGRLDAQDVVFVPNPKDEAFFPREDIVHKLPKPSILGGSLRRSCQLVFRVICLNGISNEILLIR